MKWDALLWRGVEVIGIAHHAQAQRSDKALGDPPGIERHARYRAHDHLVVALSHSDPLFGDLFGGNLRALGQRPNPYVLAGVS